VFVWRYLTASGDVAGSSDRFEDRAAAETWLSSTWEDLLDRDLDAVELLDEGTGDPVYRMSLREAGAGG
jgi:hypothetical protein